MFVVQFTASDVIFNCWKLNPTRRKCLNKVSPNPTPRKCLNKVSPNPTPRKCLNKVSSNPTRRKCLEKVLHANATKEEENAKGRQSN